ncbi:uncharacterized protein K460DRAFT_267613, partial [Cucurbitaria berberidis CBS 394.84]
YINSPAIRVIVGEHPEAKDFFVHEALICPRSEFFENAMKENWKEGEEHKVTLAKEEPAVFELYLELLYLSSVLPTKEIESTTTEFCQYTALSKLYVLAEMLMDDITKELVLAAMLARSKEPSATNKTF